MFLLLCVQNSHRDRDESLSLLWFIPLCLFQLLAWNLGLRCRSDPDGLDIDELADTESGKLASVATAFDASKRQTGVGGSHAIDEDTSRLDTACQLARTLDVARPQVATQSKLRGVGQLHCVFSITRTNHGSNRTKRFLPEDRHIRGDLPQHYRRVERALPFQWLPAHTLPPP